MTKLYISLAFILMLFHYDVFSQNDKSDFCITYTFFCIKDTVSNEPDHVKIEVLLYGNNDVVFFIERNRYLDNFQEYTYRWKNGMQSFQTSEQLTKALADIAELTKDIPMAWYHIKTAYTPKNKKTHIFYSSPSIYYTTADENYQKWEIQNEKDSLLGFEVIKAITTHGGRNYVAWFAPGIPIPYGPYTFKGLPGLILKLEDDMQYFKFIANKIEGPSTMLFYPGWEKKGMVLDKKSFIGKLKSEHSGPSPETIEFIGITNQDRAEMMLKAKARNAKKTYLVMELE